MPESLVTEVTMRATITATILILACVIAVKSFDIKSFYALTVSQSGKTTKGVCVLSYISENQPSVQVKL